MPQNLLSTSDILLFGQKVEDLQLTERLPEGSRNVRAASFEKIATANLKGLSLDEVTLVVGDEILIKDQKPSKKNGIYKIDAGGGNPWSRVAGSIKAGMVVSVNSGDGTGDINENTKWDLISPPAIVVDTTPLKFFLHGQKKSRFKHRRGANRLLEDQLSDAIFARIFGFSYDGSYYDLRRPTLFLVHGDGHPLTEKDKDAIPLPADPSNIARAPRDPSATGVSVANFQFADDIKVWSYDKADYTIRMDVETGMFEQVLLDAELDEDSIENFLSGQRARVSGQRARVSGQRARVSGQRVRIGDRGGD
jgi:hypothetical protein